MMRSQLTDKQLDALRMDRALGVLNEDVAALLDAYLSGGNPPGDAAQGRDIEREQIEQVVSLARRAVADPLQPDSQPQPPSQLPSRTGASPAPLPIEQWLRAERRRSSLVMVRRGVSLAAAVALGVVLGGTLAAWRGEGENGTAAEHRLIQRDRPSDVENANGIPVAAAFADHRRDVGPGQGDSPRVRFWSVSRLAPAANRTSEATAETTNTAEAFGSPARQTLPWSSTPEHSGIQTRTQSRVHTQGDST